jgi:hypothetical protein
LEKALAVAGLKAEFLKLLLEEIDRLDLAVRSRRPSFELIRGKNLRIVGQILSGNALQGRPQSLLFAATAKQPEDDQD